MRVRLTQIDGKLPNHALMRIAAWHRSLGDEVVYSDSVHRGLFERTYDRVYGSAIFEYSSKAVAVFRQQFPGAIVGGTGVDPEAKATVEALTHGHHGLDYSIYPEYPWSIGFTQRGCRLKCKFCGVPKKEGKPTPVASIYDIWREGTERAVMLLDNDFFGQPKHEWVARMAELKYGDFKVNFTQGINVRLITEEAAFWLARVRYYDSDFHTRRLYTAWDNLGDEKVFLRGIDTLQAAGIAPRHIMVYMLIGFDPAETWEQLLYRFGRMNERGLVVYPMPYDQRNSTLKRFQRWVVRNYCKTVPWEEFSGRPAARGAAARLTNHSLEGFA